jgi:putative phage-type endonuclease
VTATLLLPHDGDQAEWHRLRNTGITASRIATIMGLNPWSSPFNLYYQMLGVIPPQPDNTAMSLGRHLEPWIAGQWAGDHPEWIVNDAGLYACNGRRWQICTPDRLLHLRADKDYLLDPGTGSGLEIKSALSCDGWGDDGTDQIPVYYRAQVLWQMDTMGWSQVHVTCFFLHTRQRRDYVVSYDIADVDLMRKAALDFLDRVENREPPPVDGHKATLAALKALNPKVEDEQIEVLTTLALDYEAACDIYRQAKDQKALVENRLRRAMGDAKYAVCCGTKVATRSVYDQAEYTVRAHRKDKLVPPRTPKDPS